MLAHKVAQYYQMKTAAMEFPGRGSLVVAKFAEGCKDNILLKVIGEFLFYDLRFCATVEHCN